jgi:hypothetical protein
MQEASIHRFQTPKMIGTHLVQPDTAQPLLHQRTSIGGVTDGDGGCGAA